MALVSILLVLGYIIGSVPTGWLIARALGIYDIQKVGSGNCGATNVARICGMQWFLVVFFLDALKAYIFLWFSASLLLNQQVIFFLALALLIGNTCSVFLGFTGGKGVATAIGLLFFLHPILTFFLIVSWLVVVLLTKTVGIASTVMMILLPIFSFFNGCSIAFLLFSVIVAGRIIWLHRKNILQFLHS